MERGIPVAYMSRKRTNTKLEIIRVATQLFVEQGYNKTSLPKISKILNLSLGNITFHFPTKEHLLAVLVDELCDFQNLLMENAANEGQKSLLSYCLELTSMAAICEEDEATKDFFTSAYASAMSLKRIRENDTAKTKAVFAQFCPDWTQLQWEATENIISGIEYATLMTRESDVPLAVQIESALNTIMMIYGVPEELRKTKIEKVLAMDYRGLGRRILKEFKEYIDKVNEENMK